MKNLPIGYYFTFGSDPELFLSREVGKVRKRRSIVGSDVVIPKGKGLNFGEYNGSIVRDGAQVEIHPPQGTCRASQSNAISALFSNLHRKVLETNQKLNMTINVDFSPVVRLTPGDLKKMSPESRLLGCLPSFNAYGRKHIEKDGTKYLIRAAGGHLHFGCADAMKAGIDPAQFAKICDVIIGIPCVLIDRHPLAALRRKVYGRAGEYRTPDHGFEYRTLSNFWLYNYKLMSLVTGLAHTAFYVAQSKIAGSHLRKSGYYRASDIAKMFNDAEDVLLKDVDFAKVEKAINTNNFEMAKEIFEGSVAPFIASCGSFQKGLTSTNLDHFRDFYTKIRKAELDGNPNPLTVWFKEDPLTHWMQKGDGHGHGWESYASRWISAHKGGTRMEAF